MMRQLDLLVRAAVVVVAFAPFALPAQQVAYDRSRAPALAPAPALSVPTVRTARLDNGVGIRIVQPIAAIIPETVKV